MTEKGRALATSDLARVSDECGAPSVMLHRADLQRVLLDTLVASGGAVRTGRECRDVEEDGAGPAARFRDGGRETGDLLVGADGIRSAVRASARSR